MMALGGSRPSLPPVHQTEVRRTPENRPLSFRPDTNPPIRSRPLFCPMPTLQELALCAKSSFCCHPIGNPDKTFFPISADETFTRVPERHKRGAMSPAPSPELLTFFLSPATIPPVTATLVSVIPSRRTASVSPPMAPYPVSPANCNTR